MQGYRAKKGKQSDEGAIMTTRSQIELSSPIRSMVRAATARQAARDARRDTETVEVMYSLTQETVAAENHFYSRCA